MAQRFPIALRVLGLYSNVYPKSTEDVRCVRDTGGGRLGFSEDRCFCPDTRGWKLFYKAPLKQHIADVTNYVIFQQAVR